MPHTHVRADRHRALDAHHGTSAQITSFRVVTEDGTVLGPFELPGSSEMRIFPVEATAHQLRFEVVESSGGNTGVVELAAYGEP